MSRAVPAEFFFPFSFHAFGPGNGVKKREKNVAKKSRYMLLVKPKKLVNK